MAALEEFLRAHNGFHTRAGRIAGATQSYDSVVQLLNYPVLAGIDTARLRQRVDRFAHLLHDSEATKAQRDAASAEVVANPRCNFFCGELPHHERSQYQWP